MLWLNTFILFIYVFHFCFFLFYLYNVLNMHCYDLLIYMYINVIACCTFFCGVIVIFYYLSVIALTSRNKNCKCGQC